MQRVVRPTFVGWRAEAGETMVANEVEVAIGLVSVEVLERACGGGGRYSAELYWLVRSLERAKADWRI